MPQTTRPRLVLFGIDGASPWLLEHWMGTGDLPQFTKFLASPSTVFCRMRSTTPPHTAPGWVSMMTGVNPGKHGIYQFWHTQDRHYGGQILGLNDWGAPPFWSILNRYGLSGGIVNVPMTHPPSPLQGYMVSWPLTKTLRYSYPPDLLGKLAKRGGHYLSDIAVMYDGSSGYLKRAVEITEKRTISLKHLLAQYPTDVVVVVYTEVDRICHYYWPVDPRDPVQWGPIREIYRAVDQAIGEILAHLPEETTVVVASDHGFGPGRGNFYVQNFLHRAGLLEFSHSPAKCEKTIDPDFQFSSGSWFRSQVLWEREINWSKTLAYMPTPGCYGVNINLKGRQDQGIVAPGKEYEKVRNEVRDVLLRVCRPSTSSSAFMQVLNREDVYSGGLMADAPDLVLVPDVYDFMVHPGLASNEVWGPPTQTGLHTLDGIFMIRSASLVGRQTRSITIEDVAPTILAQLGMPIPYYCDGVPIPGLARDQVARVGTDHPVGIRPSMPLGVSLSVSESAEVEKRLRNLGYME